MISFEYRILSEYKIKAAKVDTLVKSIMVHREPKSVEAKDASEFLHIMINDCLLYTSPSPRDQRGSRMPSTA